MQPSERTRARAVGGAEIVPRNGLVTSKWRSASGVVTRLRAMMVMARQMGSFAVQGEVKFLPNRELVLR